MSSKGLNKPKGRSTTAVDNWLDSLGLYRKNVALDETCLFRAVSEHLFECQIYHERVRRECVEYGRQNFYAFWDLLESEDDWYNHMDLLENHMVVCGSIEIELISCKYNHDVILYDASKQQVLNVTQKNLDKSISLCVLNGDHYDVVLKKEHIKNAGFCQSLVYNILYENVFGISDVQDIVQDMLYDKKYVASSSNEINNNANVAPFTFKVAKALDPTIYRNIEFDSWSRIRREMRLGDWYYGDDNLILGTKCLFNQNDDTFECYIQRMVKNENRCEVYIVKLAERRVVNYTDLSPEDDAKPWPLPYRFCKNLQVASPPCTTPEKILKLPKKRKDKRKNRSSESQILSPAQSKQDIEAFIGAPLQIQDNCDRSPEAAGLETPKISASHHNLLVTPDIRMSWDSPWSNYGSPGKGDYANASEATQNYNNKPMIASAPITPNVIPFHDDQFMYNCPLTNYNPYSTWSGYDGYATQSPTQCFESTEPVEEEQPASENVFLYTEQSEAQPVYKERPTLCTPLPQNASHVYSPVVHCPPGTPGVYTPQGLMPAVPLQVYTPPVDVQYVSPRPVMYLPTPPATWYPSGVNSQIWYPPGVNAQGFIFQPVNRNAPNN